MSKFKVGDLVRLNPRGVRESRVGWAFKYDDVCEVISVDYTPTYHSLLVKKINGVETRIADEWVELTDEVKPPTTEVRTFESGATRNLDTNKLDYEGFNCPAAQRAFAEYMHTHRKQADGTVRDSDNWQRGIPAAQYMKSIVRHVHDLHSMHRGWVVVRPEDGVGLEPTPENKIELLSAVWFNVQGMIHELLKMEKKS